MVLAAFAKPPQKLSAAAKLIAPRTSAFTRAPPTRPVFRAQLVSHGANGRSPESFIPTIRKLVFEYDNSGASSQTTRTFLKSHLVDLARENPHVEVVVRQRNQRQPIIRGFYANDRDKVICLRGFEVNGIQKKVQLLLDASGNKIKSLKRRTVESTSEAARGIWSGMHVHEPFQI